MNDVLAKVEKAEPEIGALLRRCCADERNRRPSTKQLVHSFKRLNGAFGLCSCSDSLQWWSRAWSTRTRCVLLCCAVIHCAIVTALRCRVAPGSIQGQATMEEDGFGHRGCTPHEQELTATDYWGSSS